MRDSSCGDLAGWQKSSTSEESGCVEVRPLTDSVQVRDSKDPDGAVLEFSFHEWNRFLEGVRLGDFDVRPGPA
jgi:hypothetical protein